MSDLNGFELPAPVLMPLTEAARLLGVHRSTLHKMCVSGCGPDWIWVGSKIMIPRQKFEKWLGSASRTGAGRKLLGADA